MKTYFEQIDWRTRLLSASILLNIILFLLLRSHMATGSDLEAQLAEVESRAVSAEISGKVALLRVEQEGKKVYQLKRLYVSEKTSAQELKKQLGDESRRYKNLVRSLNIKLQAALSDVTIPAYFDSTSSKTDSMIVRLPQRFAYRDSNWVSIEGSVIKSGLGIGVNIGNLTLNTGDVSVLDMTPKNKLFSLRAQEPVVRLSIESPYFSMLSVREFSVPRTREPIGIKILTHAATFAAGAFAYKIIAK